MVDAFAAYAEGEKAHRVELERRRLEAVEYEKRRREEEWRRPLEGKRLEFLEPQMDRHEAAVRIENCVASYPPEGRSDEKVAAFLDWASDRAARLRAEFAPTRLREKLDRNDLMNDEAEVASGRPVE